MAVFLSSCGSTSVMSPSQSEYGPKNYKRKGMIKYLNNGADFVIKSRREDAYKTMHTECGGGYEITTEGPKESGGMITPMGDSLMYSSSEYWYIAYECV